MTVYNVTHTVIMSAIIEYTNRWLRLLSFGLSNCFYFPIMYLYCTCNRLIFVVWQCCEQYYHYRHFLDSATDIWCSLSQKQAKLLACMRRKSAVSRRKKLDWLIFEHFLAVKAHVYSYLSVRLTWAWFNCLVVYVFQALMLSPYIFSLSYFQVCKAAKNIYNNPRSHMPSSR